MNEIVEKLLFIVSVAVFAISYGVSSAEAMHVLPSTPTTIQMQSDAPDPIDTNAALTGR